MKNEIEETEELEQPVTDAEMVQKVEDVGEEEEDGLCFDLTEDYDEIFGPNAEFDSWDDFSNTLEEFSKRTGFYYKPRSACTVEYLNEKRVNSPIPDKFVYAKVKMICLHYGDPPKDQNGTAHRKGFNYVGKGCESYIQMSYNKGALKVGKYCLIHKNHQPRSPDDETPLRQFRNFTFSEDLDILIAREVLRSNPFELANGEKRWTQAVEILKGEDIRLANLTPRLIKKRIRFLIDKFVALSHGRMPAAEDEMGQILYDLNRTKRDRLDNPPGRGKKRKSAPAIKFSPSMDNYGDLDYLESGAEEETSISAGKRGRKRRRSSSPAHHQNSSSSSSSNQQFSAFISFLKNKDEEDRKLRLQQLELSKEELQFRKREMDFQKQRFEFEKYERKAHLDLLKSQLAVLERSQVSLKQEVVTKEREHPVEYTIVLDNNQQTVVS